MTHSELLEGGQECKNDGLIPMNPPNQVQKGARRMAVAKALQTAPSRSEELCHGPFNNQMKQLIQPKQNHTAACQSRHRLQRRGRPTEGLDKAALPLAEACGMDLNPLNKVQKMV